MNPLWEVVVLHSHKAWLVPHTDKLIVSVKNSFNSIITGMSLEKLKGSVRHILSKKLIGSNANIETDNRILVLAASMCISTSNKL